ncbi:hypothetical protein F5Y12DRAFT_713658 [Xylaria sp. FL1777]|nr:hypothetical protein F5Y12DRAFT_713658 [Xylaria sp. FL1777]
MVNDNPARGQYPSRPAFWYPGRIGVEYYSEDGRLAESSEWRGPPWTINRSLRELCQIPGNTFFVAAEENGRVICLSTPIGSSQLDHEQFFDKAAFVNNINQIRRANPQPFNESELGFVTEMSPSIQETTRSRTQSRHHYQNSAVDSYADDEMPKSKKRPRAGSKQTGTAISRQKNLSMITVEPKRGIRISDSDAVYAIYDHHLKCCQQTACKLIAKAWVKAVAPKKQSTNPYTRGDESRPDWWPKTYRKFGENNYRDLRHKEPDHLGKEERVYLLCHILRMVIEPEHKQHHAIRKVNLNLTQLESFTFEALSSFFGEQGSQANWSKKPLLKDIFRIARQEARYKDNEINGNTEVFATSLADGDAGNEASSDSEDEEDLDRKFTPASTGTPPVEPSRPQIMMSPVQVNQHGETSQYPSHSFPESVTIRAAQYPHPEFEPELSERASYVEAAGVGNQAPGYNHSHLGLPEMYSSPQGTSRRSSVFNSPSDYGSPATPVTYSPWPTSSTPSNPSLYGFPPQPSSVQAFGQLAHGPPYAAPTIDGLSRQTTEAHQGDMFASRTVGQCAMPPQPPYPNYVTDGAPLVGPNIKSEGAHHPSIHQ